MTDNILKGIISIEAKGVSQTASQVSSAVGKMESNLKKLTPTSSAATQSLINLSRVAQDAPYGIIGIANNINPLLESFQRLRAESTSTGAALKAFGNSLLGAGGLGLAVGIATSLMVVFSGRTAQQKQNTEELNKATEEAKKKQEEFQSALDSASASVLSQSNKLQDLRAILISTNSQFEGLTKNIINQAVTQYLFDKKNAEVQKILNAEIQRKLTLGKQLLGVGGLKEFTLGSESKDPLIKQIDDAEQGINILNKTAKALGLTFETVLPAVKVSTDNLKVDPKKIEIPKLGSISLEIPTIFDTEKEDTRSRFAKQLADLSSSIQLQLPVTLNLSAPGKSIQGDIFKAGEFTRNLTALAESLGKSFSTALQSSIAGGLESIGQGIGNILSGKGFGAGLVNVIGDLLTQIGKALLAYGVVKAGLDKILGPGGIAIPGGVALALGVSAIAFGQIFKNFAGARAAGGPVSGGQSYLVGENGPELFSPGVNGSIIPNGRLSSMSGIGGGLNGRVVFEISGNKLRGILSKVNKSALGLE